MFEGRRRGALAVTCFAVLFVLGGCGDDGDSAGSAPTTRPGQRPSDGGSGKLPAESVSRARCPAGSPGCRSAEGRIVYVERNDPDGDGDAHFVILDPQGITFRGLTAIDVRAGLRPRPLPAVGDLISAAGPVQTGSFGQSQIHALVLNVGS